MFEESNLSQFIEAIRKKDPELTRTRAPRDYWSGHAVEVDLSAKELQRADVLSQCRNPDMDDASRLFTVIAWGVARPSNRTRIFENRERIQDVMAASRASGCPVESYRLYREAAIPGLGPAYWTKLIHFCEPSGTGYILDRFTAISADVLMAEPLGLLRGGWVPRSVDERQYAAYCAIVRALAERMSAELEKDVSPADAEFSMYAGREHPWRAASAALWRQRFGSGWRASLSGQSPVELPDLWFTLTVHDGASLDLPGIYEWRIEGVGSYVGRYTRGTRPTREYSRNVGNLLGGRGYRAGNATGFRRIHLALADAVRAERGIELRILENPAAWEIAARERELIAERGTLNGTGRPGGGV